MNFFIKDYLQPGEYFHYARKYLIKERPERVHCHDYYECFWLEQGQALHWINDQQDTLEIGQLVFIRPTDVHAFQALGDLPCRLINISFVPEIAEHLIQRYRADFAGRFFWSDATLPESYRLNSSQRSMLERLACDLELSPCTLPDIESFLLGIMTRLHVIPTRCVAQAPKWLIAACQAARNPEVFREGAAGFVEATGHCHEHVCRTTRLYLGVSPSIYINRIRMEYAARLLSGSDESISGISLQCGLDNISHFYSLFKKHFGMTPKAYRQRYRVDLIK